MYSFIKMSPLSPSEQADFNHAAANSSDATDLKAYAARWNSSVSLLMGGSGEYVAYRANALTGRLETMLGGFVPEGY